MATSVRYTDRQFKLQKQVSSHMKLAEWLIVLCNISKANYPTIVSTSSEQNERNNAWWDLVSECCKSYLMIIMLLMAEAIVDADHDFVADRKPKLWETGPLKIDNWVLSDFTRFIELFLPSPYDGDVKKKVAEVAETINVFFRKMTEHIKRSLKRNFLKYLFLFLDIFRVF